MEIVIFNKYKDCLYTQSNQFGFKDKHSTDIGTMEDFGMMEDYGMMEDF